MEEYINVNNFNVNTIEAGKLYTLYYELSDEELNNKQKLGQIIENLWDKFMYNTSFDSNIHLDRKEKLITISVKLKDNVIYQSGNILKSLVNFLGQTVTNMASLILDKTPIAVTVSPLIVQPLKNIANSYSNITNTTISTINTATDNLVKTISETPIVQTTVNTAGNIVDSINKTFESVNKISKYLPYIIVGCGIVIALSYSNIGNIKKLFRK